MKNQLYFLEMGVIERDHSRFNIVWKIDLSNSASAAAIGLAVLFQARRRDRLTEYSLLPGADIAAASFHVS